MSDLRKEFEKVITNRAETKRYKFPEMLLKRNGYGYATTWVDMMWKGWCEAVCLTKRINKAP